MFDDILTLIVTAINAVFSWFEQLMSRVSGASGFFLGVIFVVVSYRFLLMPLLRGGGGRSDKAKKSGSKNNDTSSEE